MENSRYEDKRETAMILQDLDHCNLNLFHEAPVGYLVYDYECNLLFVNEYFRNHFNLREEEINKHLVTDFISHESREDFYHHIRNVAEDKDVQSSQIFLDSPEGKLPVKIQSNMIHDKHGILIRSVFLDILPERKLEEDLRVAKKQAEDANKEKTRFLANICHEIRTPMNGITGFLQLLEQSHTDEEQRDYIKNIKTSTDLLLSIINDILDVSKMEAGEMRLENISFDLRRELENAIVPFSVKAAEKGIDLNLLIHSDVPAFVFGDPFRLKQTLINLISNAIKFTDKGYVFLEVKKKQQKGSLYEIEFSVTDTGIGISKEGTAAIFKPFSQADPSAARLYGGTGLGLAICKTIVELMGGRIHVESKPERGTGTVFFFDLWMKESAGEGDQMEWFRSFLKDKKILVAEPNSLSRAIIGTYLTEAGCMVTEAASVLEEASLKGYREYQYDLLILDKEHYDEINRIGIQPEVFFASDLDHEIPIIFSESFECIKKQDNRKGRKLYRYLYKPYRRDILLKYTMEALRDSNGKKLSSKTALQVNRTDVSACCKMKVLLAEDNMMNRNFLLKLLENRGIEAHYVSNGEEAVNRFRRGDYDLIFMDCQMPVMDGYEAARKIRSEEGSGQHVHIVALTGNTIQGDAKQCYRAGMDEYLCKPVDIKEIDTILSRVCRKISC